MNKPSTTSSSPSIAENDYDTVSLLRVMLLAYPALWLGFLVLLATIPS